MSRGGKCGDCKSMRTHKRWRRCTPLIGIGELRGGASGISHSYRCRWAFQIRLANKRPPGIRHILTDTDGDALEPLAGEKTARTVFHLTTKGNISETHRVKCAQGGGGGGGLGLSLGFTHTVKRTDDVPTDEAVAEPEQSVLSSSHYPDNTSAGALVGMCHSSAGSLGTAREQFVPPRHRARPHREHHLLDSRQTRLSGLREDVGGGGGKTQCSAQASLAGIQTQVEGSNEILMPRCPIN